MLFRFTDKNSGKTATIRAESQYWAETRLFGSRCGGRPWWASPKDDDQAFWSSIPISDIQCDIVEDEDLSK